MKININQITINPNNPRIIKDDKFKKLAQSLRDFPEMVEVREVIVNKDYMILGGNMRFKAMKDAGWKEIPVKIVDWSEEKQKEFIIKDNANFGEWDYNMLSEQYESPKLALWGIDEVDFDNTGKNKEIDPDELTKELDTTCPKCGFEFKAKKSDEQI